VRVLFSLLDAAIGGGQRVALQVGRRLVAEGDEAGLLVPGDGPAAGAFRGLGAEVHPADLQTLRRMSGVAPATEIAQHFDVLYSHTSVPGEILGARVARRASIPHVVHRHTDPYFSPRMFPRLAQQWLYRRELHSGPFIAVAPHVAARLERLGIARDRITVIPNGVDVDAVRARARDVRPRAGLTIGVLGRFDPSRGLDVFVEAASRVSERELRFVIGGAPGPFHEYETAVRSAAAQAEVTIEKPGSMGIDFLASIDIVVIPSRYEGSPLTLFEAMALGKPIVASRIPGITEVVEPNDAGILISPGNPGALAGAIEVVVTDPARRDALGRRALEAVRSEYDLGPLLARLTGILHAATRSRR
jgi:starch synthase